MKEYIKSEFVRHYFLPALVGFSTCCAAWGASFQIDDIGRLEISGEIQPGDGERAVKKILSIDPILNNIYLLPSSIVVNSMGGDIRESMKIASLVKAAYMNVMVAPSGNGACASSCFFIYLAGQERRASGIDKIQQDGPKRSLGPLGIHRPYYRSTQIGPRSVKRQEDLMAAVMSFLQGERVPQSLIDQMMAHPSNEMYWLNSQEIKSLRSYQAGVEEELISHCGYSAKREEEMSARDFIRDVHGGVRGCISKYLSDTYGKLRDDAFAKMRGGWRPWNN